MNDRRRDIAGDIERIEASPLASRLLDVPRLKRLMLEWPSDEHAAEARWKDYHLALGRGVHVGRFICSVEGGNR
jgi:asparagine synthase (glutamine-hydrolysing)